MRPSTLIALVALSLPASAQSILRVDASAPPGGDGSSWALAYQSLDQALAVAGGGTEVWVAAGVYRPRVPSVPGDGRSASFRPAPGVRLYGGFDGSEATLAQRAGLFDRTVLDGDIGIAGRRADNCYHVLRFEGNGAQHTLDGFRVQNGQADQTSGVDSRGGAIYVLSGTKRIRRCRFVENHANKGGAIDASGGLLYLTECRFANNRSFLGGGALRASFDLFVAGCVFERNRAGTAGGAVFLHQNQDYPSGVPRPSFQNCLFVSNAARNGGAVEIGDGNVSNTPGQGNFVQCTFYGNVAREVGGAIRTPAVPTPGADCRLRGSILWGNRATSGPTLGGDAAHYEVLWSTLPGGWPGDGNAGGDPLLVAPALGDLRLGAGSPCIDSGPGPLVLRDFGDLDEDGDVDEPAPLDLGRAPRFVDDPGTPDSGLGSAPMTDRGCYEFQP